jgi:hypothetical protein
MSIIAALLAEQERQQRQRFIEAMARLLAQAGGSALLGWHFHSYAVGFGAYILISSLIPSTTEK